MGLKCTSLILALAALALTSCDEVDVRIDDASRPVTVQEGAARILFPAAGIATLYDLGSPDGFALMAEREVPWSEADEAIAVGPVDQTLNVTARTSLIDNDEVVLTTRLRNVSISLPVRVNRGPDLTICRYRVTTDAIDVVGRLRLIVDSESSRLEVVSTPAVEVDQADVAVQPLGACALPNEADFGDATFDDVLIDYALTAIAESGRQTLTTSPLELGGIVTGRLELDRRAPFANRRGTLAFEADLESPVGLQLSERGIDVFLDLGVAASRASCAPPVELPGAGEVSTAAINSEATASLGADLAFAFAAGTIQRLAQGMVLSGFACRGLEDARPDQMNEELFATEEFRLDDIGLGALELGPWARVTSAPGSLPSIQTRPDTGALRLEWRTLTLELYGEVRGAPARILTLNAGATATLRARRNTTGFVRFDVDAIEVSDATIESPWLLQPASEAAVRQWARRALLLVLSEQFVLPLPLVAPADVRVVGTEVRSDDMVLYLAYD